MITVVFAHRVTNAHSFCDILQTPLCQHHYYLVYGVLQSRQTHCTTCGTRITQNNHRPCPNPDAIAKHLQDKAGFEGEIHANDRVCIPCYKSQLVILQELQTISTNSDLELIISTLSLQIPTIDTVKTLPDVVKVAMAKTAIFVGNLLLDKWAILLPTIHDHFSVNATELIQAIKLDGVQNVRELVTSKLQLSELTVSLQHHMAYTCTVCKYGTLVYKPGKDLAPLLCEACGS